jgi:hypothetical protein
LSPALPPCLTSPKVIRLLQECVPNLLQITRLGVPNLLQIAVVAVPILLRITLSGPNSEQTLSGLWITAALVAPYMVAFRAYCGRAMALLAALGCEGASKMQAAPRQRSGLRCMK